MFPLDLVMPVRAMRYLVISGLFDALVLLGMARPARPTRLRMPESMSMQARKAGEQWLMRSQTERRFAGMAAPSHALLRSDGCSAAKKSAQNFSPPRVNWVWTWLRRR